MQTCEHAARRAFWTMGRSAALCAVALSSGACSYVHVIRVDPAGGERRVAASLEDAVARARRVSPDVERVVIQLAPGLHTLPKGIWIDGRWPPLTIRALDPRNPPVLTGGHRIEQPLWQPVDATFAARLDPAVRDRVFTLQLPLAEFERFRGGLEGLVHSGHAVTVDAAGSCVLIGPRALRPARWPDEGFAAIGEVLDVGSIPRQAEADVPAAKRVVEPARGGVFVPADRERARRWVGEAHAWALGYWNWDWSDELLPVTSVDEATGAVRLGLPHRYGLAARGRFAVMHAASELDNTGEYYLDREHGLLHAVLDEADRQLPVTFTLLAGPLLELQDTQDTVVEDVVFAASRGAGVVAHGARGLRIVRCRFEDLGTSGAEIEGTRCVVAASSFERIGGTGVLLSGGDRRTLTPGENLVSDCVFRRCGELQRTYHPAIDLRGVGQAAVNNEIADMPHFALVFAGNQHRIAGNHIHDVVLETGDAGAVYNGRDWTAQGTRIEGNLVHSIPGDDKRFQNAFYLDDMASGTTLKNNLVVRCNWGMLIGGGRDVTILDNTFVGCGKAISYDARGVGWMAESLADPASSTLHQNYAAVPVDSKTWRRRYPKLRSYLKDRFGRPVGGSFVGNLLVATPLGNIEDPQCVDESRTTVWGLDPDELDRQCNEWIESACRGPLELGNTRLGPVGPRGPVGPGAKRR